MDRGQNGRDDFFGGRDPFAGFGGFGPQRSLISGFFGRRDPFDDPFFTQPFEGRMMGGHGMFGPSLFGPMGGPFGDMRNDGFIQQAPPKSSGRRPVITELDEEGGENAEHGNEQSNQDSYVQEPDDASDVMEGGQVQLRRNLNRANSGGQSQARTSHIRALQWPMVVLMELITLLQRLGGLAVMGSLWKKARKQIQQLKRPLIEYHEEYMIRATPWQGNWSQMGRLTLNRYCITWMKMN
jgi:hypothetical protein